MKLKTTRFGEVEIEENKMIDFEHGLPGFKQMTRFVLIHPYENVPMTILQSADDESLSFIVTNPFLFYPEYEFDLPDFVQKELKTDDHTEISVWSILTVPNGNLDEATINLLAPVVVNTKERKGKQVILHESQYQTKHELFAVKKSENASSVEG